MSNKKKQSAQQLINKKDLLLSLIASTETKISGMIQSLVKYAGNPTTEITKKRIEILNKRIEHYKGQL